MDTQSQLYADVQSGKARLVVTPSTASVRLEGDGRTMRLVMTPPPKGGTVTVSVEYIT